MKKEYIKEILGIKNLKKQKKKLLLQEIELNKLLNKDFIQFRNIYALIELARFDTDEAEGRRSCEVFIKNVSKKRKIDSLRFVKYVAIWLVLLIPSAWVVYYFYNYNKQDNIVNNTLYVPAGQRAKLTLSDGTVVWLNACTTFIFPSVFSKDKREVSVIGEAFLDVAKDEERPFILSSQDINLKVLGTQFNIQSYPEAGYIRTDLLSGSVKVYKEGNENNSVIMKPNEQITIKAEEIVIGKIKNPDYFLWKSGVYSFDNESLKCILRKIELYYDTTILVKDSTQFNVRYTGKFRQQDGVDEILRVIQKVYPFRIEKDIQKNIFTLIK